MNNIHYMDNACIGRPANTTLEVISNAVRQLGHWESSGTTRTLDLFEEVEKTRKSIAQFLHVDAKNIALINNTTHGLGVLASLIDLEATDNILVPDIEFISSALVWRQAQHRIGFEIRSVKTKKGKVTIKDFENHMDENTKVIMTSSVQEVSGYRLDVKALMELAQSNNTYLLIDGIQEVGALQVNLSKTPIHAYCSGGHKWLGNPFGLGFMYVDPTICTELMSHYDGYFSLNEPENGWESYLQSRQRSPFDSLQSTQAAKKFETGGTPNWLGAVGLRSAVEYIEGYGIKEVERKVLELNHTLRSNLRRLNLWDFILGGEESKNHSGILTYSLPGGIEQERQLLNQLEKERVYVSLRSISEIGGIRVSPNFLNTTEDIQRLSEITESFLKSKNH
jgi:cysteine desulfurase/selenocysteine lyase